MNRPLPESVLSVQIRTEIDLPIYYLAGSIHSVGEALLVFLDALPEPVIPVRMYAEAMEASATYLDVKKVVARLPGLHRRVFHHLVAFLRELLVHSLKNKLEARSLGEFLTPYRWL